MIVLVLLVGFLFGCGNGLVHQRPIQSILIVPNRDETVTDTFRIIRRDSISDIIGLINSGEWEPRIFMSHYVVTINYSDSKKIELLLFNTFVKIDGRTYRMRENLEKRLKLSEKWKK